MRFFSRQNQIFSCCFFFLQDLDRVKVSKRLKHLTNHCNFLCQDMSLHRLSLEKPRFHNLYLTFEGIFLKSVTKQYLVKYKRLRENPAWPMFQDACMFSL